MHFSLRLTSLLLLITAVFIGTSTIALARYLKEPENFDQCSQAILSANDTALSYKAVSLAARDCHIEFPEAAEFAGDGFEHNVLLPTNVTHKNVHVSGQFGPNDADKQYFEGTIKHSIQGVDVSTFVIRVEGENGYAKEFTIENVGANGANSMQIKSDETVGIRFQIDHKTASRLGDHVSWNVTKAYAKAII